MSKLCFYFNKMPYQYYKTLNKRPYQYYKTINKTPNQYYKTIDKTSFFIEKIHYIYKCK